MQKSEKKNWLFAIGVGIGLIAGLTSDKLILWLPIGVAIGFALRSAVKDAEEENEDEK